MKKKLRAPLSKAQTIWGSEGDIIKVTKFTATPARPKLKQKVQIKMTIKNVSKKKLEKVPWRIVKDKKVLDHGIRYDLSSGDSFNISTTWTATSGSHFFYADADPNNILNEPKIRQFNNLPQGVDVIVE
jgi:hypothetical protein